MNTNEMTELEMQLHSWVPRPPSASLSRRLFAHRPPPAPQPAALAPAVSRFAFHPHRLTPHLWLGTAAAALALLCFLSTPKSPSARSGATAPNAFMATVLSNQNAFASLPGTLQLSQTSAPSEALEWTNPAPLTSSISPPSATRRLN